MSTKWPTQVLQAHCTARADVWGPTNYRINWQSTNPLKPWHHFSGLTTSFIYLSQSDSLKFWQNAMAYFWSGSFAVWEALASLKRCSEVILRIELNRVTVKFWSHYLRYLQSHLEIFIPHLAAAVPLLETANQSPVCRYIIEICPILMACTWKNCVLLAALWDKISILYLGQMEHCSVRGDGSLCARIALLLASFDVALPSEREKPRFPPPRVEFYSVSSPRAGRVFEWAITQPVVLVDPWHHIDQLCIRALTSARAFAAGTCCARPRVCSSRSLNIFTARDSMGLSSRRRMLFLASYRMALTRERKNPSRIAREIEIFSILLSWSPRWSRCITRGFEFSAAQSVDHNDWLTFKKHLVERKSQFPCGNYSGMLFLRLAQK